jgi:hypothetical protein
MPSGELISPRSVICWASRAPRFVLPSRRPSRSGAWSEPMSSRPSSASCALDCARAWASPARSAIRLKLSTTSCAGALTQRYGSEPRIGVTVAC